MDTCFGDLVRAHGINLTCTPTEIIRGFDRICESATECYRIYGPLATRSDIVSESLKTKIAGDHDAGLTGGRILEVTYFENGLPNMITFRCRADKHTLTRRSKTILKKTADDNLCQHCSHIGYIQPTILDMKAHARRRGGDCISDCYINNRSNLEWKCSEGHTWTATCNNVVRCNSWCPVCASPGDKEEIARQVFRNLFPGHAFAKAHPTWLKGLELDGYEEELNLAFEYDGIQHMKHVPHFHRTAGAFEAQQARDAHKNLLCVENGVTLIRIPYHIGDEEMTEFVRHLLEIQGFAPEEGAADLSKVITQHAGGSRRAASFARLAVKAREHGGECLEERYIAHGSKHKFRCALGHEFYSAPIEIFAGKFCAECGGTKRKTDAMRKKILEAAGVIYHKTSRRYDKNDRSRCYVTVTRPCCGFQHETLWDNIRPGPDGHPRKGCPSCAGKARRASRRPKDMTVSGVAPAETYINNTTEIDWNCVNSPDHPQFRTTRQKLMETVRAGLPACVQCTLDNHLATHNIVGTGYAGGKSDRRKKLNWKCNTCGHQWLGQLSAAIKRPCPKCSP